MGRALEIHAGTEIAILAFGSAVTAAQQAGEELNASVVNMRFVKPIDIEIIIKMAETHRLIVTVEDNVVMGGAGSAVNEVLAEHQISIPVLNLGLPDYYQEHGSREELLSEAGLDSESIVSRIRKIYPLRDCEATGPHVVSG